jgi:hypothetical protein
MFVIKDRIINIYISNLSRYFLKELEKKFIVKIKNFFK